MIYGKLHETSIQRSSEEAAQPNALHNLEKVFSATGISLFLHVVLSKFSNVLCNGRSET